MHGDSGYGDGWPHPAPTTKTCVRCEEELATSVFGPDRRQRDGLQGHCRSCAAITDARRAGMNKARAVALRGGRCEREGCGYTGAALVWHHRDPQEKEFTLGQSSLGWDRYWAEVQKCDLLCSNCHIEHYAAETYRWLLREKEMIT